MWSRLQTLAGYSFPVVTRAIEVLCPGVQPLLEVIRDIREQYLRNVEHSEREDIRRALHLSAERMDAVDELLTLLFTRCSDLLQRMEQLERQGRDSADEVARAALATPELQRAFDAFGQRFAQLEGRVDRLDADVQRLDAQYASLGAFAQEMQGRMLSETELADFRAFRRAKQLQADGQFAESEPILRKLANSQNGSAAVAVALAVAQHDDPPAFDNQLKRAKQLRPQDANLAALASAATLAVTGRNTPAHRSPAGMPSPLERMPTVGDTLDGWHLEARIGGGGWGIVFRGNRNATPRALKVMRPKLVRERAFVDAFTDEVFKLLRVNHANIVRVERNGFCTAFQCHYFVMPLIEGVNLEQHLARFGKPTPQQALTWLMGLLDGLEAAHAQGLIHRDIKPQNVMIRLDGTPVLIDFGIAGLTDVPGHTQAIGKSSFFAPPELQSIGQADVRSDLFMLAATIFYALRYDQPWVERANFHYESSLVHPVFRPAFDAALSLNPSKRPADVANMRRLLTTAREDLAHQKRDRERTRQWEAEVQARAKEAARQRAEEERQRAIERQRQEEDLERQRQLRLQQQRAAERQEPAPKAQGGLSAVLVLSILGLILAYYIIPRSAKEPPTANQGPTVKQGLTVNELCTLTGHISGVSDVAFSPDGKQILTGSCDKTAKVWDAETGKELRTLTGHKDIVWGVAFSPDGKRIVTGGEDKSAKVWDAETGKELRTLTGHTGWVKSVAYSPDGKRIVTGSDDKTAKVWDADTGNEIRSLKQGTASTYSTDVGHWDGVSSVAYSLDGKRIVTGSRDKTAKVWQVE